MLTNEQKQIILSAFEKASAEIVEKIASILASPPQVEIRCRNHPDRPNVGSLNYGECSECYHHKIHTNYIKAADPFTFTPIRSQPESLWKIDKEETRHIFVSLPNGNRECFRCGKEREHQNHFN